MTKLKKIARVLTAVALIFAFLRITMPDIINANADGVAEIAMEQSTGRVLMSKNERARLPMASTTKIMTALLICEDCDLSECVEVPDEAVGVEGSSIYLKQGEKLTVKDLLYGLMLRSGNDASVAIAIVHSGSVDEFVKAMNERAALIGADDTHFANPNGLPDENHYTTAYDLCLIACKAMDNEIFRQVVSTTDYKGDYRNFTNKNKLLYSLDGANGIKTGYTQNAGRCLVSSAGREGMDVVCVVLNCYDMYERSGSIIENCFDEYALEEISHSRVFLYGGRAFSLGKDCTVCVKKGEELEYSVTEDDAQIKLQISNAKGLIFSENLYSIM